jgi:predicted transglutaminase-like cysteine proteinase
MVFRWVLIGWVIGMVACLGVKQAYAVTQKIIISEDIIQDAIKKHGEGAGKRIKVWKRLMENEGHREEREKLELVNRFFNQMAYKTDMVVWAKSDYWATPIEFLSVNAGDCEDFSVAKFFTLLALGVPESKLRITYVKALELNESHMVLTYYATPAADPLVLDNLKKEIKPGSEREDLLPLYAFNGLGLWKAKQTGIGRRLGDSARMKKWQELNEKIIQGM